MPYVTRWEKRGHEKGLAEGKQVGLQVGQEQGRLQANRESALALLKAQVDPNIIFAATGLRPEDLNPPVDIAQAIPKR